ncbi:hypothetical protein EIN_269070 [Entamoeba invadens IP1]|uniref:Uncharacterized protein n=1 Tax=Entamoeba invadens IP1 TaxID=370355 RepID=A0A0A1U8F5_ENTIV|nr:hypothetical protein EIN_269070 [Entamoeba invadens IP1]ELP91111.1 hypothetical protein EIN_269070 [Entamoeba invadens IP1]|eukprot:XP_004257882.1 hypothetical protein EIN_269070 [Entamoeba invadens IP1]
MANMDKQLLTYLTSYKSIEDYTECIGFQTNEDIYTAVIHKSVELQRTLDLQKKSIEMIKQTTSRLQSQLDQLSLSSNINISPRLRSSTPSNVAFRTPRQSQEVKSSLSDTSESSSDLLSVEMIQKSPIANSKQKPTSTLSTIQKSYDESFQPSNEKKDAKNVLEQKVSTRENSILTKNDEKANQQKLPDTFSVPIKKRKPHRRTSSVEVSRDYEN